jgi:hypothetical protein
LKETQPQDVLVLYNGDKASALLLELVKQGIEDAPSRRLRVMPTVSLPPFFAATVISAYNFSFRFSFIAQKLMAVRLKTTSAQ